MLYPPLVGFIDTAKLLLIRRFIMKINFYIAPQVEIYERTESTDSEGNPIYNWSLVATEKAFFLGKVTHDLKEGIPDQKSKAFMIFKPDSVVTEENRVKYQNYMFRITSLVEVTYRDRVIYKLAEVMLVD